MMGSLDWTGDTQRVHDPAVEPAQGGGRSAWASDPRTMLIIAASAFLLLGLVALASVIDFPDLSSPEDDTISDVVQLGDAGGSGQSGEPGGSGESGQQGQSGQPGGESGQQGQSGQPGGGSGQQGQSGQPGGGSGRIDLGDRGSLDVRPIPGCPDGFAIGDDILVIPDPEACGFQRVAPGALGTQPSGKIILVPDPAGDIAGFRVDSDGNVGLVPLDELRASDFVIGQLPSGGFEVQRPDGSSIEIAPGDDGLSLRDPITGDAEFIPGTGEPGTGGAPGESGQPGQIDPGQIEPGQIEPGAQGQAGEAENPQLDREAVTDDTTDDTTDDATDEPDADDDEPFDFSTLVPVLLVLLVVAAIAAVALSVRNRSKPGAEDDEDDDVIDADAQDELIDYSTEISALDRLLWEIDQEADPRRAIRRVWAALETGLGNQDMSRRRSETPGIYLRRILGRFDALDAPLHELTDLFEQARFSEHEITPDMRNRAVTILVGVRGHYAEATARAQQATELVPA